MSDSLKTGRLQEYVEQMVVVDTSSHYLYIGKLVQIHSDYLVLTDVDVHDITQGNSTKEKYIMDSRKYAIKTNRTETIVLMKNIISISRIEDVITF